ncbi:MAG: hypothetical protein AMXMBFR84_13900 [Candidatus Hydrogenedentota bacterium]
MRFGIRQKLLLGFAGILVTIGVIGGLTMLQISRLGDAIDTILRENYRSVIACQEMKESLERIDSGILFTLLDYEEQGDRLIDDHVQKFQSALDVELNNITIPGEREKAEHVRELFGEYVHILESARDKSKPAQDRQTAYFESLLPHFYEIKSSAQSILDLNQSNIHEANNLAREEAAAAMRRMSLAFLVCASVAVLFGYLIHVWVLSPIRVLTQSALDIKQGNLDLVLPVRSTDELGQLSETFNEMAASLRSVRRAEQLELRRRKEGTENVFKALPATVAVLDLEGRVEVATESAARHFGLEQGRRVRDAGLDWLPPLIAKAFIERRVIEQSDGEGVIQRFIDNEEHFFKPVIMPIPVGPHSGEVTGVAVMLRDVTYAQEQAELKQDAIATVSHQLKTPLTSLRLSLHLLLNDQVGVLNEKQVELVLAARDDCDRLSGIVCDLLDIRQMQSGKSAMEFEVVKAHSLTRDAVDAFLTEATDKGIALVNRAGVDVPSVLADADRMKHVFSNILSNAIRCTTAGGEISVDCEANEGMVKFSISDTGAGMSKDEAAHAFEPFYRADGQPKGTGAGLGLTIARQIVAAHGGSIGVESELGHGTTVWFTLPAASPMGATYTTSME